MKLALVLLLDLAIVVFLAGSPLAAVMFLTFLAGIVVPAMMLARRIAPLPVAAMIVILPFVPWFFLRKASGMPAVVDVVTAAVLIFFAWRAPHPAFGHPLPAKAGRGATNTNVEIWWLPFLIAPILFALVWLGWSAAVGNEVRFYGLFGIDFGNLVSVVTTLRASPMLPLSYLDGAGPLTYHWLYFTIPAALANFGGGAMPNANALVLTNLLIAMLFAETVRSIASDWRAAAIVLFAPFTTYYYEKATKLLPLGPLGLPEERNHLLLSPLNSMLTFGNNCIALVLAILALVQLECWNREGRMRDLVLGCIALAVTIGYSVTLLFPLVIAIVVWTLLGRVRRPLIALSVAALIGLCAVAMFYALHVLGGGSAKLAVAFDRGAFLRMIVFGAVPLWGVALLAARRELTVFHDVIASCVAVPSLLYIAGNATGAVDFSMKTASLLAVAFAPLLVISNLSRWRAWAAGLLVALGLIQSAAYVLQFPYYRVRNSTAKVALPRDYANALVWIREHTPVDAVVVDPHEVPNQDEVFTLILGERRVWLPTTFTNTVSIDAPPPSIANRPVLWRAFSVGHDERAGAAIAREADVLLASFAFSSPSWRSVHREGAWTVYRSTLH